MELPAILKSALYSTQTEPEKECMPAQMKPSFSEQVTRLLVEEQTALTSIRKQKSSMLSQPKHKRQLSGSRFRTPDYDHLKEYQSFLSKTHKPQTATPKNFMLVGRKVDPKSLLRSPHPP